MSDNSKNDYKISSLPQLPNGWVWVRLGEIVESIKGKKPKNLGDKNEFLKFPYINIEAFEFKRFNQFTDGKDCPTCEPYDILIVWDGARCGLVGRGVKGVIGSTLAKLDCADINKPFLFYFLQTKYEYINKHPRGVGIPHVEPNLFWNIPIPLPSLAEQHRIVAKIEELFTKLDAGVEALKKAKEQIKRYRQAVLKYAFEGKLTEEWRVKATQVRANQVRAIHELPLP
ncbi:MAG: restriction endonuclease subunit S [Nitrospirae bacterium]|jgi:type I restriction enzyme S subunit|nr:restriction endonuclease subunit S [Nitrospirota bacterium]